MDTITTKEKTENKGGGYSEAVVQRAPIMVKWLMVIFWTLIVSNIMGIVCQLPALIKIAFIVEFLAYILYFYALLKLKSVDNRYGNAAGFCLAGALFALLADLQAAFAVTIIMNTNTFFSLLSSVLLLISCYYEYYAHRDIIGKVDPALGKRWISLWHWKIACIIISIVAIVMVFLSVILSSIVLLALTIITLYVGVIVIVTLYQSAKAYRRVIDFTE